MTRTLPTAGEIREYLIPFDFFERYVGGAAEGHAYIGDHAERFRETLAWLADLAPGSRVLELGAVPYYMTILVQRHLGAQVDPLSFYEVEQAHQTVHEVTHGVSGERFRFNYVPLNVERDLFPVTPGTYDAVLCCEILEHLLINPSHMVYEAHRALRPGGRLLVTTPNVARWGNLLALAGGRNINDRYHGNGIYGRHNREYTLDEVVRLLEACGFAIERAATRDVYARSDEERRLALERGLETVASGPREDTILVSARATGDARMACPEDLYVLMDEHRNVVRSAITMGRDEVGQIGSGWYGLEHEGDRGVRWSSARARFFLRPGGGRRVRLALRTHHPDVREHPVTVGLEVDGRRAGTQAVGDHEWHELAFELDAVPESLDCVLTVDRTWRPSDISGDDRRDLGVRVARIWME